MNNVKYSSSVYAWAICRVDEVCDYLKSHNIKNVTMVDAEKRHKEIKEFVEGKCKEGIYVFANVGKVAFCLESCDFVHPLCHTMYARSLLKMYNLCIDVFYTENYDGVIKSNLGIAPVETGTELCEMLFESKSEHLPKYKYVLERSKADSAVYYSNTVDCIKDALRSFGAKNIVIKTISTVKGVRRFSVTCEHNGEPWNFAVTRYKFDFRKEVLSKDIGVK